MHNIRSGDVRWNVHDFPFDGDSNDCSIHQHLQDIRKSNKFPQSLTLKVKVKLKEKKIWTGAIRLEMFDSIYDFFQNFNNSVKGSR